MKNSLLLLLFMIGALAFSCRDSEEHQVMSVERYIALLKSGQYKAMELPAFKYEQISELIQYINADQIIKDAPVNPLSSMYVGEVRLGMYVAWTIESIRTMAIDQNDDLGRFPSLAPCVRMQDPDVIAPVSEAQVHLVIAKAYQDWWELHSSQPFEVLKQINPLENTSYRWY